MAYQPYHCPHCGRYLFDFEPGSVVKINYRKCGKVNELSGLPRGAPNASWETTDQRRETTDGRSVKYPPILGKSEQSEKVGGTPIVRKA